MTTTLGFTWEHWRRDGDREVRNQNDFGPTARVDWRAAEWARLRAGYAFSARLGSSYDSTGALSGLRKYPQADRLRHRFDLLAQLDPRDDLGVTLTTAFDLSDFDDSDQGLTEDNRWNIGVDLSYRPHQRVGLWANYAFDYIWMFQEQGGEAWDSTTYDRAHNGGVGADVALVPHLLDLELSYLIQRGRAKTRGGGTAVDFPSIKNTLQAVTAGVSYHALEFLTFRTIYRWEKYDVTNFHDNFGISDTQGDIWLQNRIDDYDAHIVSISAVVKF